MDAPSPLPDHGHGWQWREVHKRIDGLTIAREIDIIPVGDRMMHLYPGEDCWCGATHSLDGRELVETREPE